MNRLFFMMGVLWVVGVVSGVTLVPTPRSLVMGVGMAEVAQLEVVEQVVADADLGSEGYRLSVGTNRVTLAAASAAGLFYARQSWAQVANQAVAGRVPLLEVVDGPRTEYRVLMLDSGRQYQGVARIKRLLDGMAALKLNVFHWHLTENAGWRIPIARYPRLSDIGSRVGRGPEQVGCYTRAEIAEVVAYARERFIMVVPEVDLPGHADAALSAYPEWSCAGKVPKIGDGISKVIFCAGQVAAVQAMKDILSEVAGLFPAPYLHIGGDEAPKDEWNRCARCQARMRKLGLANGHELQVVLMRELAEHVKGLGKQAIVWNDAVVAGSREQLPVEVIVQYWNQRGDKGLANLQAAQAGGRRVIFTPNTFAYLNFPYEPWGGYGRDRTLSVGQCIARAQLPVGCAAPFGAGAALWCDYGLTVNLLDERLYPRLLVLAEFAWNQRLPADHGAFEKEVRALSPLLMGNALDVSRGQGAR